MRSTLGVLGGLLAFAVVASGCAGAGDGAGGGEVAAFTAQLKEPVDLIPGATNEMQGSTITSLVFAGLTTYDEKTGEAEGLVAEAVRSQDNETWTVELEPGWTFHNGEPVTAESFVGAWNATVRNGWRNAYFFTDLLRIEGAGQLGPGTEQTGMSGLDVLGERKFRIELQAPNANLPLIVGYTGFYPMPESVLREKNWDEYRQKPIGNGPYRMAEPWNHDKYIKLTKNAEYSGQDKGNADEITFKIYTDPSTAYSDAVAGTLDITNVPPSRLASAPKQFRGRYVTMPGSAFVFLGMPLWMDDYADPRIRRAISMAIDREKISEILFNGTVTPAKGLVSPLIELGRRDDPCGKACGFRPEKAGDLFEAAGGIDGKMTLWFDTGGGHQDWVQAVANQLHRNLGVTVELSGRPWSQYPDLTREHKVTGPYRLGWIMDYPAPENYLAPLYSSHGSSNGSGYRSEKVDELLTKASATKVADERIALYHEAEDQILDDLPVVPLWFANNAYVHSDGVTNLGHDARGYLEYAQVEVVD